MKFLYKSLSWLAIATTLILTADIPVQANCEDRASAFCRTDEAEDTSNLANDGEIERLEIDDWRDGVFDLPWSRPLLVVHPFDGEYLAVADNNFSGNLDWNNWDESIISIWSEKGVRIVARRREKRCAFFSCNTNIIWYETNSLDVKIGDTVFSLEGSDGNFRLSDEQKQILATAPAGEAIIRVYFEGRGNEVINDIGEGTVEAWRTVFSQNANDANSADIGHERDVTGE